MNSVISIKLLLPLDSFHRAYKPYMPYMPYEKAVDKIALTDRSKTIILLIISLLEYLPM